MGQCAHHCSHCALLAGACLGTCRVSSSGVKVEDRGVRLGHQGYRSTASPQRSTSAGSCLLTVTQTDRRSPQRHSVLHLRWHAH